MKDTIKVYLIYVMEDVFFPVVFRLLWNTYLQECAMLPHARFRDIARNLQALDLDETAHYNPFMTAFGVRVSSIPITVSFAISFKIFLYFFHFLDK